MIVLLALSALAATPAVDPPTPPELGAVSWGRRLEPALELSERTGKPLLLLFQEVPG